MVLCAAGILSGHLKLKWMQARILGFYMLKHPGKIAEAEMDATQVVLVLPMQGVSTGMVGIEVVYVL